MDVPNRGNRNLAHAGGSGGMSEFRLRAGSPGGSSLQDANQGRRRVSESSIIPIGRAGWMYGRLSSCLSQYCLTKDTEWNELFAPEVYEAGESGFLARTSTDPAPVQWTENRLTVELLKLEAAVKPWICPSFPDAVPLRFHRYNLPPSPVPSRPDSSVSPSSA